MIDKHLEQLRATLEQAQDLPESTRTKLLELLATVENEAATTATKEDSETEPQGEGMNGLLSSVEQLEASHPEIASLINQVAITLSRMGI
ncbi:MAG: hypothetical protein JWO89_3060 [Verrucomicrobiaceae bacterium]|nr:hypothetical protein [Verrucomicrobiaceae bacterium]MDB6117040.1 hypothetical protein [Verrucomicrobiaceae bacterium]